ncbi:TssQ family T6SS-associated lipoprotein [Undibacterium arcticum]|uniref:TssQ family T6SS-associated lipoprotein n=2 Tax=Undibacterium arcticum TaxID=1762892 RepID=A0ABV7F5Q9_9BURK
MPSNLTNLGFAQCVILCFALIGCAEMRHNAEPAPKSVANNSTPTTIPRVAPAPTVATIVVPAAVNSSLKEGLTLYDNGDFNGAIQKLSLPADSRSADKSTKLTALKTMAFSYCVTTRMTLCRQQFDKALKLDPSFDLDAGEKQHPLWGPVFKQAKKKRRPNRPAKKQNNKSTVHTQYPCASQNKSSEKTASILCNQR